MHVLGGFSGDTGKSCYCACLLAIFSQLQSALSMPTHQSNGAAEEHCDCVRLLVLVGYLECAVTMCDH